MSYEYQPRSCARCDQDFTGDIKAHYEHQCKNPPPPPMAEVNDRISQTLDNLASGIKRLTTSAEYRPTQREWLTGKALEGLCAGIVGRQFRNAEEERMVLSRIPLLAVRLAERTIWALNLPTDSEEFDTPKDG